MNLSATRPNYNSFPICGLKERASRNAPPHKSFFMMSSDQQFFLKWNDFQTNMVTSFRHLRDEKSFTDVSINNYRRLFRKRDSIQNLSLAWRRKSRLPNYLFKDGLGLYSLYLALAEGHSPAQLPDSVYLPVPHSAFS